MNVRFALLVFVLCGCSSLDFSGFRIRRPCDGPCGDVDLLGPEEDSARRGDGGGDGSPGDSGPADGTVTDGAPQTDSATPVDGAPQWDVPLAQEDAPWGPDAPATPDATSPPDGGPGDALVTSEVMADAGVDAPAGDVLGAPEAGPADAGVDAVPEVGPDVPAPPTTPAERARYCSARSTCLDCLGIFFADGTGCAWCATGLRSGVCQYGTPTGPASISGICEAPELRWRWGWC